MFSRRHWIPPGALIFAQLSHGASWLVLGWAAISGSAWSFDFLAIAWVHIVVLGWATTAATGILLHVIPQFADVSWRLQNLVRRLVFAFAAGVVLFVAALLLEPHLAVFGAGLIALALLAYFGVVLATLWPAFKGDRTQRAIARALATTLAFLVVTALLGFGLATMISGYAVPAWVATLPATHASLGMFGWLSLLVFGVSARTVRPITGNKSRSPVAHIAVGSLTLLGVPLLAIGLAGVAWLIWPGAILFGAAAAVYAFDMADILRRTTMSHRVPPAFLLAGITWLVVGLILGAGTLAGHDWEFAYVFVILAGWIGQMLNAHIYHIGVRVLLTVYRGDDDETRPHSVLDARLSWGSFAAFQLAIGLAAIGLLAQNPALVCLGAGFGGIGWVVMIANLFSARSRAMEPATISLL
ncbi:MAG: hypothetical protein ABI231_05045 [Candidatus Tumulicola sp.]